MEVACFANSDFPAENPRIQNRNFPYTNRCHPLKKNSANIENPKKNTRNPIFFWVFKRNIEQLN